ncbi:MAG: alpha/beta fold hydrolase [Oscillospiraceae bacterium]
MDDPTKKRSTLKLIGRIFLVLLILVILFISGSFAVHRILCAREYDLLEDAGLANPVSAGEYDLNVCSCGNENGRHTLVALSGMGVHDYSVALQSVTDSLADDDLIVFIDRAGYGLSEDTFAEQTIERVVEDYRTALKNAGIEGPYVLLPHSLGGAYATYWVSNFPDEIEGIAFLDGSQLCEDAFADEEKPGLTDIAEVLACKAGLHRLVLDEFYYPLPDIYSEEQQSLSDALNSRGCYTFAQMSEYKLITENCKKAFDGIVTNDVPKIYISSSFTVTTREEFRENVEWMNKQLSAMDMPPVEYTDSTADKMIEQSAEAVDTILMPYLERLGNCEYIPLSGDHAIYMQKPEQCADIIGEFLDSLDE